MTTTETVTKVEVTAVEPSDAPRYTSSPSTGHAIYIPVNLEGRVVGVQMSWEFRTQCETDHDAFFYAPNGFTVKVMSGGGGSCTGKWQTSSSGNDFSAELAGISAKGDWAFNMKDTVANQYSGRILNFKLVLRVDNGSGVVAHRFDFPGPNADIPQPN